jgi:hypothetical protein
MFYLFCDSFLGGHQRALIGIAIGLVGRVGAGRMVDAVFLSSHHAIDAMVFGSMARSLWWRLPCWPLTRQRAPLVDPKRALRDE